MNKFSKDSLNNLNGIHLDLARITHCALAKNYIDFGVTKTSVRTLEQQKEFVRIGKSQTMKSLHLPQTDGYSHAVDLFWYDKGIDVYTIMNKQLTGVESAKRDQLVMDCWNLLAKAMFESAISCGVMIEWGGFWKRSWDKPHFELTP